MPTARIEYWDLLGHGNTSTADLPLPVAPEEYYQLDQDFLAIDVIDR